MVRPSPFLLLSLVGCRGLTGTWEGTLLCLDRAATITGDATLVLAPDGGGEWVGEMQAVGDYQTATVGGDMVVGWSVQVERTRPAGRQALDGIVDDCVVYLDGLLYTEDCFDDQLTWTWDGADTLTMQGPICELTATR
ncbi:MAG: hypothetical protein D6798_18005 [Deltaproteobacteria bacterium]|nr:MAG: hypothetical protein D6798_18005 [Deltaproteobacteria bacterium]